MDGFDYLKKMNKKDQVSEDQEQTRIDNKSKAQKKQKRVIKNVLVYILALFLAINTAIYTTVVVRHTAFSPHKKARFILSNAMFLNVFYIIPIGKITGPDFPILVPLRAIKDKLHYTGVKYLPEDDAEAQMWWYMNRYQEFDELYNSIINNYVSVKITAKQANLTYLLSFTDEMYYQLEKMANIHKLEDNNFKKIRFKIFVNQVAFSYVNDRYLLIKKYYSNFSNEEINRYENILNWYFSLKDYCKENEKKGYDFVFNNHNAYHSESRLVYLLTSRILKNKIAKKETICNTELTEFHIVSRRVLEKFASRESYSSYNNRLLNTYSNLTEKIKNKCGVERQNGRI